MNIGKVAFKLTRSVTFGLAALRGVITVLIAGKIVQEDGTSGILLEDGTSFLILEG